MTTTTISMEHIPQVDALMQQAALAYPIYRKVSGKQKAAFLRLIATGIENLGETLIETAHLETHLPHDRLRSERQRTLFQLEIFAQLLEEGSWVEARLDMPQPERLPIPKPDVRKMLMGIGPVVVFGASNFPFAYSTAGGDTASALAAGCPVVVKGHPAHAQTSAMVAQAISQAVQEAGLPQGVFGHIEGHSFAIGQALVCHPETKAVGFTGSLVGGKALFDLANQRPQPIPVFAEMGSINPVVLLPARLEAQAEALALQYAQSITSGVGQFCTNPGLLIGIKSEALDRFLAALGQHIAQTAPATMLHAGIYQNFEGKKTVVTAQEGVTIAAESGIAKTGIIQAQATIATVDADTFLANPTLHQEVFGPFSLLVQCANSQQLVTVVAHLEGQLTATIIANETELLEYEDVVEKLRNICGRLVFNGVPTGVEVGFAMQHGGPFPASTDARFGAVGPDAIKRFVRPVAYQNFPEQWLPDELKKENPLQIWRIVEGVFTK